MSYRHFLTSGHPKLYFIYWKLLPLNSALVYLIAQNMPQFKSHFSQNIYPISQEIEHNCKKKCVNI